jgi:DNA-binding SARP family transcriptional activator/tetratricopeptide (TPR) repeat protein
MRWRILGPVEVAARDEPMPLPRPQQRSVLAYLLLNANHVVSTGRLVEALWGPAPPASARVQVQSCISQIRRALRAEGADNVLTSLAGGYRLSVADGELDLAVFTDYVARARAAAASDPTGAAELARAGLAEWRGAPLAGAVGAFVEATAASLREQRISAFEELIDLELALGRHGAVVAELRAAVEANPFHERLAAQLMLALAGCGQQTEALRVYRDVRARLAEELGVEPAAEVAAAHLRVLRQQVSTVPGAKPPRTDATSTPTQRPAQLPADIAAFAGRAAHLRQLDALLPGAGMDRPRTVVISAIQGTAGVGKTALAVHWAHRVADRFPDGQLYVNLRGFDPGESAMTPAEALRGFLDALGVTPQRTPAELDAQAGLYRSLTTGKRMLIVLDNVRDADQVRRLLPGGPGCLALVTSRNRLTSLVALEGADPLTLDLLGLDEARQLLAGRLGSARVLAQPRPVNEIITKCARLPLALAIVAAHAAADPALPLGVLAAQLGDAPSALDVLDAGDPAANVRAVLSWSYRMLSSTAAALFRLLGLHPGPEFALPAAASLAGVPVRHAGSALLELTRAHLLTERSPGRYAFHDLLRSYAAELAQQIDGDAERHAAIHRLLDHFLHTAHAGAQLLDPHRDQIDPAPAQPGVTIVDHASHATALDWFIAEHQSLIASVTWGASAGFDTHSWQLASTLIDFLERRGHWHDLIAIQRVALQAAARLADRSAQARTHRSLARAYAWQGDHDDAHVHLQLALDLFEALNDDVGQASTHLNVGGLCALQGRPALALEHAQQALGLFRAVGHLDGCARALNNIGWYHARLGDYGRTLACCQEALRLHRELGDRRGTADTLHSLGYAHQHLGHHGADVHHFQQAADLYRELGDRPNEADSLAELGDARLAAGETQAARAAWRRALDIFDDLGHPDAAQVRAKIDETAPAALPFRSD